MIDIKNRPLTIIALLLVLAFVLIPPFSIIEKARLVGYAVCHQMPSRSFFLDGEQLPMCARNTGIFLGALTAFVLLLVTGKAKRVQLPPPIISFVLFLFIGFMAIDGINSYLPSLFRLPNVYEPQNWLRLLTGTFAGIAVSVFLFPAVNYIVWRESIAAPVVEDWKELSMLLLVGAVLIIVILFQPAFLLIPVSMFSALGVLYLLAGVDLIIVLIALGWEYQADDWRDLVLPVLLAVLIALIMIVGVGQLRSWLLGPYPIDLK